MCLIYLKSLAFEWEWEWFTRRQLCERAALNAQIQGVQQLFFQNNCETIVLLHSLDWNRRRCSLKQRLIWTNAGVKISGVGCDNAQLLFICFRVSGWLLISEAQSFFCSWVNDRKGRKSANRLYDLLRNPRSLGFSWPTVECVWWRARALKPSVPAGSEADFSSSSSTGSLKSRGSQALSSAGKKTPSRRYDLHIFVLTNWKVSFNPLKKGKSSTDK